jgi:hypothetical protein
VAFFGSVHFRDLKRRVELHKVTISPPADEVENAWCYITAYPNLTYWTAESLGFVILYRSEIEESPDFREWYFVYANKNYYWHQFWIIDDEETTNKFVFVEGRSPSFSTIQINLGELETFNSDDDALAAGYSVGDFYIAGAEHERASTGSITSVLA